jgi:hypothetical protein
MAVSFATVVKSYQDELKNDSTVPKGSFKRSLEGDDGFPTRLFFVFLFGQHERGVKFLQDCGLLKTEMLCPKCGSNMRLQKDSVIDKYRWGCCKGKQTGRCSSKLSLRYSSLFTRRKLTLLEVMLVTSDILLKVLSQAIREQYQTDKRTACDWFQF